MARDQRHGGYYEASPSEDRVLPQPLSTMALTARTALAVEDQDSPVGAAYASRPPSRSLYSPRAGDPGYPRPRLVADTPLVKDSLDETIHGLAGIAATAGKGQTGKEHEESSLLISTYLPNSVYLWACGETTRASDDSPTGEECSASDMVVGWLTLASQILAYSVLIWNRSGEQDSDGDIQVFLDPHGIANSSSSNSSGDVCAALAPCNVSASLGTPDDPKDYSIVSVAVAMFLVVSTSSPDVRVAYSLLLWGRGWTHCIFGLCLLVASTLLVFASMVVLFDKAADNTDLVIGAAAILFVAETDEKIMAFLTAVPRKWRLFWMLETIGVSFALAMIGVDYFGDGTAVMPKDESGESFDPRGDNLADVMYTSEKSCPAAMSRNFSFGMAMFYYDRLKNNSGASVYPLEVSLLLTPVVMTLVSFWCNSLVEVLSDARGERPPLVSHGGGRWVCGAISSFAGADLAYAVVLVAWYLHGLLALLAYALHLLYPVMWLVLFVGPFFLVVGIVARLCRCTCMRRRGTLPGTSPSFSRWPSLAIGWGGGYVMALIFFCLKVHLYSLSILSAAFMLLLTVVFALTLADVEMWGKRAAGSGLVTCVVKSLKNDASVLHWTIMSALQYFSIMWAMFMMDMIFMCMLK